MRHASHPVPGHKRCLGNACVRLHMGRTVPISEACRQLGSLVRRASTRQEWITITDHREPAAIIISAQELADLDD